MRFLIVLGILCFSSVSIAKEKKNKIWRFGEIVITGHLIRLPAKCFFGVSKINYTYPTINKSDYPDTITQKYQYSELGEGQNKGVLGCCSGKR